MKNNSLRGAVVGVGYLGKFHAEKYKNNSLVNLIGVYDLYTESAKQVAEQLKIKQFHQLQDLVGKVDIATIATTTQSHFEVARFLLENGIHVNIEKPITATSQEARDLLKIAEKNNLKIAVGHIERFNPVNKELKRIIKKPQVIELTRHATYKKRGADVSVLHDLMIHDLDLLLWLSDSEIVKMEARGSCIISAELDVAVANFVMKNGTLGIINVSRVSSSMNRSVRIIDGTSIYHANTAAFEIEKTSPHNVEQEPVLFEKQSISKVDALQSETDAFIESVYYQKPCVVSGYDGLKALEIIEELHQIIQKSAEE